MKPTRSPQHGSERSSQMDLFLPATSMSVASSMSEPMTFADIPSATSSPASAAGPMPSCLPDGPTTDLFGQVLAPANPSVQRGNAKERQTSAICGPHGFDSSTNADLPLFSVNRSPPLPLSARQKKCRKCSEEKDVTAFRLHNKGGHRGICRDCENSWVRETKPWQSERKRAYQQERRKTHRGFSLTNDARRRALEKGIPFDLDWREIQERINTGLCEVTGLPFCLDEPKSWNAPSLDQIEPSKGYTRLNTRVVLYALNTMANNWGLDTILQIADAIRERRSVSASNVLSRRIYERLKQTLPGSTEYDLTWRTQVTPSGHVLYQLVPSTRRISGSASSGWRTPQKMDGERGPALNADPKAGQHSLTTEAQLAGWPTPRMTDAEKNVRTPKGAAREIAREGAQNDLGLVSGLLPFGSPATTARRGALNPAFSRWLMGYPPEWDDYAATAMPSSRKRQPSSSGRSAE